MQNVCWKVKWRQEGSAAQKTEVVPVCEQVYVRFYLYIKSRWHWSVSKTIQFPDPLACSLRVSLHLWGIGPTNGTRPVGLRIEKRKAPGRLIEAVNKGSLNTSSCRWFEAVFLCQSYVYYRGLTLNHLSTHFPWNSWLHGRTRSSWRDSKSLIHTTHL